MAGAIGDPQLSVVVDEYSELRSEMTGDDETWSKSMTCRPVRVRSRPIFCFPFVSLRGNVAVSPWTIRMAFQPSGLNCRDESGLGQRACACPI